MDAPELKYDANGLIPCVVQDAHTREVLGDVIVQAARNVTLVDSRTQTEGAMGMPGVHGSQTMLEMDVPCIVDLVD